LNWGAPHFLQWLWLLIPLLLIVIVRETKWHRRVAALTRFKVLSGNRFRRVSKFKATLRAVFLIIAVAMILVSLARPRWGFQWSEVQYNGVDVLVLMDVSRSMDAQDVSPSRLEAAKRKLLDLTQLMRGDRLGLVVFSGAAFVQSPLTTDYSILRMYADLIDSTLIPVSGTALADAMRVSVAALKEGSPDDAAGRAVLLLSDGEDLNEGMDAAIKEAKDAGVKVYAIGFGSSEGAPIPEVRGGFKKDSNGNVVLTKLDEEALKKAASETGGVYARATAGDEDLMATYVNGVRGTFKGKEAAADRQKIWHERFQWPLTIAFVLLLLEFFLVPLKPIRGSVMLALILVGMSYETPAQATGWLGDLFYRNGDFARAEGEYAEETGDVEKDAKSSFNRGNAQFRQGKYKEAQESFEKAARSADTNLRGSALYNLGGARAMGGKLEESLKAYEEAQTLRPDDKRISENIESVKRALEDQAKREEEKKKQQQQNGEKGEDKKNEDESSDQQNENGEKNDSSDKENGKDQKSDDKKSDEEKSDGQDKKNEQSSDKKGKDDQSQAQKGQQGASPSPAPGAQAMPQPSPTSSADAAQAMMSSGTPAPQPSESGSAAGAAGQLANPDDLTKERAEALLRGVEDKMKKYLYRPEQAPNPSAPKNGKDW